MNWLINELVRTSEESIKQKKWQDAEKLLTVLLTFDKEDPRALTLSKKISDGFIESAASFSSAYDYREAIGCYKKAFALSKEVRLKAIIENMQYSIGLPELYLEGVPYNTELSANGIPWDKSFGRISISEDDVLITGFEPGNVLRCKIVTPFDSDNFSPPTEVTKNRISSTYGERRVYVYTNGGGYSSVHDGIDYGILAGTPVHATARGKVFLVRMHIVTGNTILIEHLPSVFSVYYHLSKISIKEGDMVEQGDIIGEVGSTDFSTAAHLHYSVFVAGIPADPEFFIENKPID